MLKKLTGLALLLMLATGPANARLQTWTWDPPTTGTPVAYYQVEVNLDGGGWIRLTQEPTTNQVQFDQSANVTYTMRVRGVDAAESAGPWSPVSAPDFFGAPGACGKPRREP